MRYLGMPLFALGAIGFAAAIAAWLGGDLFAQPGRGSTVMLYVAATGLSLGTFGTHNDTALALLTSLDSAPEAFAEELAAERQRDAVALAALKATPKTAWGLTLVALALHALAASRLLPSLVGM